ncbi:MAG: RNA polymerase sigma factor [Solirubrobacterales bacterium]
MARDNDRIGRERQEVSGTANEYAAIRRAPIFQRGPRLHRNADPDEVIEREYELLKEDVLKAVGGKLAASKIQFSELDMDGFYNQAWHSVYIKLADGEVIENRQGMLVAIAYRRALDEFRALHPDRRADAEALDTIGSPADVDALLDDRAQLQQFMTGMRARLSERELQAAGLCYVYGYTRPEAAEVVGVRPKRMEKIMDSVSKKINPLVGEIRAGEWCESQASLINAYALGLLDEGSERYEIAVEHLKECSACRRDVLRKRGIAAAIAPLPFLFAAGKIGTAGAAAGTAGAVAAGHSAGSGGTGGGLAFLPAAAAGGAVAVAATALVIANPFSTGNKASPPADKPVAPAVAGGAAAAAAPKPKKVKKAKKHEPKQPPQQTAAAPAPQPQATPAPAPAPAAGGSEEFELK